MATQKIEVIGSFKDGMTPQLRGLQKEFQSLGARAVAGFKGLTGSLFSLKTAIAGIAGLRLTRALTGIIGEGAKLHDTARALGVTTESLSSMAYALDQAGASADDAGPILGRLAKVIGQVRSGDNREASRAFRDLGISLAEVRTLKADEMFERIVGAMAGVSDEADRAALASELLGRGMGEKVLPVFAEGTAEFKRFKIEAKDLGIALGGDAAKAMDDFDDAMKRLKGTANAALRDALVKYLPDITNALTNMGTWISTNRDQVLGFFDVLAGSLHVIGTAAEGLASIPRMFRTVRAGLRGDTEGATREFYGGGHGLVEGPGLSPGDFDRAMGEAFKRGRAVERQAAGGGGGEGGEPPLTKAQKEWQTFAEGVSDAFENKFKKEWMDFGNIGRQAVDKIMVGGMDMLVDSLAAVVLGTKSAKEAFRDLGAAVIQELTKIIIRLIIVKALSAVFGGGSAVIPGSANNPPGGVGPVLAKGGVVHGNRLPLHKYGMGGIARGPQLALYGEGNNAEAFVPLPDNRSIPVTLNGGGAATNIFNIYANDAASFEAQLMRSGGTLMGLMSHGIQTNAGLRGAVKRAV